MTKYIPLDALVAEIDKHLSYYKDLKDRGIISKEGEAAYRIVRILKSDINSLEVKEVDLDFTKEVDVWVRDNGDTNDFFNVQELAKHFFELGMQVSSKAQK